MFSAYVVTEDGETYYTPIFSRSIEQYAATSINGNDSVELQDTMKAMVVYGDYAKNFFGN